MSKTLGQIAYEALCKRIFTAPWERIDDLLKQDYECIAEAVAAAVQPEHDKLKAIETAALNLCKEGGLVSSTAMRELMKACGV